MEAREGEKEMNIHDLLEQVKELKEENEELHRQLHFLDALRAAGVDNWEGYDLAHSLMEEMYPSDLAR